MPDPYRKYDTKERPVGFDWKLLLVSTGRWLGIFALSGVLAAAAYVNATAPPKPLPACHDTILNTAGLLDSECAHPAHTLHHEHGNWVCRCAKGKAKADARK